MKKFAIAAAFGALCLFSASAQMLTEAANTAKFEMKAHTTVGYNFDNNASGMETSIDQIQIWFEVFPYATRGVPAKKSDVPVASIRAEGVKYAFKWFSNKTGGVATTEGDANKTMSYSETPMSFEFDRIVAELLYKDYWFRVADTSTPMYSNHASIKSIYDDVYKESQYSNAGFPLLPITENLVQITDTELPMTGMLSAGGDLEKLSFAVKAGSKATWETNTDNAWVFGADLAVKPMKDLTLSFSGLGANNYEKTDVKTNPVSCGIGVDYLLSFTDKIALRPFAGYDFKYETASKKKSWEIGGGTFLYWRGPDYLTTHDEIHSWDKKFPVGLSLSANINQDKYSDIVFSLFEETGPEALIRNLGGFAEFEAINLSAVSAQDSAFGAAAQVEYLVTKKIKPYVFEKYVQGYKSGKLTDIDTLTSRVGVEIMPVKRFTIDVRYNRDDSIGTMEAEQDKGSLTCNFKMKL